MGAIEIDLAAEVRGLLEADAARPALEQAASDEIVAMSLFKAELLKMDEPRLDAFCKSVHLHDLRCRYASTGQGQSRYDEFVGLCAEYGLPTEPEILRPVAAKLLPCLPPF